MKIIVMGCDGYIGWPLTMRLTALGYDVVGIDNYSRRERVAEVDARSATPIASPWERFTELSKRYSNFEFRFVDVCNKSQVDHLFEKHRPDAVVHLAEIPSAPYSMISQGHCIETMENNVNGTLNILWAMKKYTPDAHLIKIGTMGEYGTSNLDIPEGFMKVNYRGREDTIPFPKQASSWYHQTKVHDTNNCMFASKIWGLRITDIMQGVLYGVSTPEMMCYEGDEEEINPSLVTRFDFDEVWGTCLNRFVAQAIIDYPLTVYGEGNQTRGYLALRDSLQCLNIAIDNPPEKGEYRVFNQFDELYSVKQLAEKTKKIGAEYGLDVKIKHIPNPRIEAETHYYNPDCEKLPLLGFRPTFTLEDELRIMIPFLMKYKDRIKEYEKVIKPKPYWRT